MVARGRIHVGTSGYSFRDWIGPFYPPGIRQGDLLRFYTQHFDAVEVNSSYYRVPDARIMDQMERKTPPGFRFIVKLHQSMTHDRVLDRSVALEFLNALEPLKRAGKYDGLLAQFPFGFKRTIETRRHLAGLRELLAGEPLFVEFRHDSWITPELEPSLREHKIGFCTVDEPKLPHLMPPLAMVTSDDAYVRLHGRNDRTWFNKESGDRYDYDYSKEELTEWLKRVSDLAEQARRTYLFFNNCHAGQAARNAKLMQELLRQQNLPA